MSLKPSLKFYLILCFFSLASSLKAQQWGDYTLYSTQNSTTAFLIDTNGSVFKTWNFATADRTGYSSYLLDGGTIIRAVSRTGNSFTGGPICGKVQKVDWNGTVIWDFVYSTIAYCTHHDICPMPNGNVLLIAYESKTAAEVSAAGCTQSIVMWPDKIVEVKPTGLNTGDIVWEWHAWDHLVQNVDPLKSNYQSSIVNHPELLNINYKTTKDWMHMNGVNYNADLDQITFSSHNLNEIYVIDHSTTTAQAAGHTGGNAGKGGDFLYRWGNPAAYGASGTATINVVHDAHWIPKDCPRAGYLACFNNNGVSTTKSAVDMVNPPLNGLNYNLTLGSAFTPTTYTKRIPCTGYTSNMGGSQQLPNGNSLITIALSGLIYEIDSNNIVLWSKNVGGSLSKSFRYSACYVLGTPATPTITTNGSVLTSSAASGNQWYFNGAILTGDTGKVYTATQTGNYQVKAIRNPNCASALSAAVNIVVNGINKPVDNASLSIFPNPGDGIFTLNTKLPNNENDMIFISDVLGKEIMSLPFSTTINLTQLNGGIYYLTLKNENKILSIQKISIIK